MGGFKLSARIPVMLLGVPLSSSENPYLSVPARRATATFSIEECWETRVELRGVPGGLEGLVKGFAGNLEEIVKGKCVRIEAGSMGGVGPSGYYALLTTLLIYALARYHGVTLDAYEIIEMARYSDPFEAPSGWTHALDALRYTVAAGSPTVYRNDEEYAKIEAEWRGEPAYKGALEAKPQVLTRENLGGDVYNALVHLVGATVLEGAVRVREGEPAQSIAGTLGGVQNGVIASVWGLARPEPNCILEPGLPGEFEVYCW